MFNSTVNQAHLRFNSRVSTAAAKRCLWAVRLHQTVIRYTVELT